MNQQFVLCTQLEVGWAPPATRQVLCCLLLCCLQNSGNTWKPRVNSRSYPGPRRTVESGCQPQTRGDPEGLDSYAKPKTYQEKGQYVGYPGMGVELRSLLKP